ncbi:hypothetical protein PQX77_021491 [Marasmius sp. AFHP31]|nr:hypothetical protein PQX77_021491 [Marasmius sp. AFHP31]
MGLYSLLEDHSLGIGILLISLAYRYVTAYRVWSKFQGIPTLGHDGVLLSYITAWRRIRGPIQLIEEGCRKYPGGAFKIPTFAGWRVVVNGPHMIDDIWRATDYELSAEDANADLFKHWPYYEDYSRSIPERRLITRIPLDQEREALLGLLLQHSFLSRHISLYWGFVACFNIRQAPIYFYHDLLSNDPPYEAQAIIDMVAEAIARVGFLHTHTAFLPGAVDAWIDSVIGCMEDPPPSKLEPQCLFFFEYHPLMGRWVTRPFYHYNPILHEEFYLDELNRAESPSVWDYQREDSELDNYFRWDEVAINNMWE